MADLSGKVVVVTGASRGLGRGIAEGLADAGATVYLTGRTSSVALPPADGSLQAAARRVDELGGRGVAFVADHRVEADVWRLFEWLQAEQGRLDVLVNHLHCGRELARDRAQAIMAAQGHGLLIELAIGNAPPSPVSSDGVTALQLVPRIDKPRYSGRCVAALAMDPDVAGKSGAVFRVDELAREYRFSDPAEPIPGTEGA